jgi:hypothetical protein
VKIWALLILLFCERDLESQVAQHLICYFVVLVRVGHHVSACVLCAEGVKVEARFEEGPSKLYCVRKGNFQRIFFVRDVNHALVLKDVSARVFMVRMKLESHLIGVHG